MTYFMSGPSDEDRNREAEIGQGDIQPEKPSRQYSDEAEEGAPRPGESNPTEENPDADVNQKDDDDDDEDDDDK